MKKIRQTMMALLGVVVMTACSGGNAPSENCLVFGEVPAIYADYEAQRDKIEESAQKSEADYKKASAQIDEPYRAISCQDRGSRKESRRTVHRDYSRRGFQGSEPRKPVVQGICQQREIRL